MGLIGIVQDLLYIFRRIKGAFDRYIYGAHTAYFEGGLLSEIQFFPV
jgi:hypothetical protein